MCQHTDDENTSYTILEQQLSIKSKHYVVLRSSIPASIAPAYTSPPNWEIYATNSANEWNNREVYRDMAADRRGTIN
jgi:hypothetical protein